MMHCKGYFFNLDIRLILLIEYMSRPDSRAKDAKYLIWKSSKTLNSRITIQESFGTFEESYLHLDYPYLQSAQALRNKEGTGECIHPTF